MKLISVASLLNVDSDFYNHSIPQIPIYSQSLSLIDAILAQKFNSFNYVCDQDEGRKMRGEGTKMSLP